MQLLIFGGVYLVSGASFVWVADGITERFVAMARGPYLSTAIVAQLRPIPAYGVFAAISTLLTAPLIARLGVTPSRWKLLIQVLLLDAVIALLALGPAL